MQYLVYPMGFNLHTPINLLQVNTIALAIVTLDLLPTQEIYQKVLGYDFSEDEEPLTKGLATLGLDNRNFLLNGGTAFLTLQAWIILTVVVSLLRYAVSKVCSR